MMIRSASMRLTAVLLVTACAGTCLGGEPFDRLRVPSGVEGLAVRLSVVEPAGAARKSEPVSGGVPLPWGVFRKDQPFSLHDNGRELPAQVLPLVVDEKGSLRWVLVDAQVDLAAKGRKELVLRAVGGSAKPASPLEVTESDAGVIVDTGRIKFAIDKARPFSLFSSVEAGGKAVASGGEVLYESAGEVPGTFKASPPESIEVENAGPMRATVCVRGHFAGDEKSRLGYLARITAWAGRSDVQVKYSLSSSNPDHYCYRQIARSEIRLRLPGAAAGEKAAGGEWVTASTGGGRLWACDLYFKEDGPRALAVENGELVLVGVAAAGKPRWLMDCSHLSSQYVIDFAASGDAAGLESAAAAARGWLHLMAEPEWYAETGGLSIGRFGTQTDEMKCYDAWGWKYEARAAPRRGNARRMPAIRYKLAEDNHYETEQDNVECLLLMYLRTGSRDFLTTCQAWANFEMDTQKWRTDGWRWKDGGVWWPGGPYGNRPQRAPDPASGKRGAGCGDLNMSKQCYCHTYAAGLAGWYCLTGDRDALEAAVDGVEQNYDTQRRARGKIPGKTGDAHAFGRDFTRSCRTANAVRLVAPADAFVVEASDYLSAVWLRRPNPEPRGFVPAPAALQIEKTTPGAGVPKIVGERGMAEMQKCGVSLDPKTGQLTDGNTGAKWYPVQDPQFYHYAPLPCAMENYWQAVGSEDALDWVVAVGQGFARVLYQPHGNFAHYKGALLVDFPVRGVARDSVTWRLGDGDKWGSGLEMSGYTAQFWPDAPARAYRLTGEELLRQRAYDYWNAGSHRGYRAKETARLGTVAEWVNVNGVHCEYVRYTSATFYIHSHPRKDSTPPAPIKDLAVHLSGAKAAVSFTAPADEGGGRAARYQVKCSDKPIVSYQEFLAAWAAGKGDTVTNWWMAANLTGEPAPGAPGASESFTVEGVPANARHFAVRSFDDSWNRSALGAVVQAR